MKHNFGVVSLSIVVFLFLISCDKQLPEIKDIPSEDILPEIIDNIKEIEEASKQVESQAEEDITNNENSLSTLKIVLDKDEFQKGEEIKINITKNNIPQNSGLVLSLVRNEKKLEEGYYYGSTGPLMLSPQVIEGSGIEIFTWKGDAVGCAPTDYPTWCDDIEPGNYKIVAALYDRSDFSILGWPDRTEKKVLGKDEISLNIVGDINLKPLERTLESSALHFLAKKFNLYMYAGTNISRYMGVSKKIYLENEQYCNEYKFLSPFSGDAKICTPLYGNIGKVAKEDVSYVKGIISYEKARDIAYNIANKPYLSRVAFDHQPSMKEAGYNRDAGDFQTWSDQNPDATTYLSSGVKNWSFHNKSWLFIISEIKAGGSANRSDDFADEVLVKINQIGEACVIKTVEYKNSLGIDIFKDTVNCL